MPIEMNDPAQCTGCEACRSVCPRQCITMVSDPEGFLYPRIDTQACVQCGLCESVCPVLHSDRSIPSILPEAYTACHADSLIREESSSGGVFTALAEHVLDHGGVVFGAAMTPDCRRVRHISVETSAGLELLRGSKYVQSQIGDTYLEAKQFLEQGREVLFTGTPCQIEGLHAFLGKAWPGLICMDFICHGVPSPMVWERYVDYCQTRAGAPAQTVSFRDKTYGWRSFGLKLTFANGTQRNLPQQDDPYLKTFLYNLCLRPSCYQCAFKNYHHSSDFTVADFWGCEYICPELDDDRGLSLVLPHTQKGRELLLSLSGKLALHPVDAEAALFANPSYVRSSHRPAAREAFLADSSALSNPRTWHRFWSGYTLRQRITGYIPRDIKHALSRIIRSMRH